MRNNKKERGKREQQRKKERKKEKAVKKRERKSEKERDMKIARVRSQKGCPNFLSY